MITLISTPIEGAEGTYKNVFPSQSPVDYNFNRKDGVITSITSGADNKVNIVSSVAFTDIVAGDFVTWETDTYQLVSTRVINVISPTSIEVDRTFFSTNVGNGWINFKKRWYLEARFVRPLTATDEQTALPVVDYEAVLSSSKSGDVVLDVSVLSDLIDPVLDLSTTEQDSFSSVFKVQYRESWEGNRAELWTSPTPDVPVLLIHGSREIPSDAFIDESLYSRKMWRGYPVYVSYSHSAINDQDTNGVIITGTRHQANKTEIDSFEVSNSLDINGLLITKIAPEEITEETMFLTFGARVTSNKFQYDPNQYDSTQYA